MEREVKTVKVKAGAKTPAAKRSRPHAAIDQRAVEQRLADALAQQAATSHILRVMSDSPTDVQPVLDAVAESAAHLCRAGFARVLLVESDVLRPLAHFSADGEDAIPASHGASDANVDRGPRSNRAHRDSPCRHRATARPRVPGRAYQRETSWVFAPCWLFHSSTRMMPTARFPVAARARPVRTRPGRPGRDLATQAAIAIKTVRLSTKLKRGRANLRNR